MKGTQRERPIQAAAACWLTESLRRRSDVVSADFWLECPVAPSSQHGRGRADAVVAGLLNDGTTYTMSVEAKSMRTFRAIRGRSGCVTQFLLATVVSLCAGMTAVWYFGNMWGLIVAVASSVVAWLLVFSILWKRRIFFKRASVIEQVLRYPGDEHWIAVTRDAARRSDEVFDDLLADCRVAGVGVLEVGRQKRIEVWLPARCKAIPGDKLKAYRSGNAML